MAHTTRVPMLCESRTRPHEQWDTRIGIRAKDHSILEVMARLRQARCQVIYAREGRRQVADAPAGDLEFQFLLQGEVSFNTLLEVGGLLVSDRISVQDIRRVDFDPAAILDWMPTGDPIVNELELQEIAAMAA